MFKISSSHLCSVFIGALIVLLSAACSGPTSLKIGTDSTGGGGKQKDSSDTTPQVVTIDDQFALAFNELQWHRRSVSYALNPTSAPPLEGCASAVQTPVFLTFLTLTFNCKRASDDSDSSALRRFEFKGDLVFSGGSGNFSIDADALSLKTFAVGPLERMVGAADIERHLKLVGGPTTYRAGGDTTFTGGVVKNSGRLGEKWVSTFQASFDVSSNPETIAQGSYLTLTYSGEAAKNTTQKTQSLKLVAETPIHFALSNDRTCLRPVGTFRWTLGEGETATKGTLLATPQGFKRSDAGGLVQPWGARCLER